MEYPWLSPRIILVGKSSSKYPGCKPKGHQLLDNRCGFASERQNPTPTYPNYPIPTTFIFMAVRLFIRGLVLKNSGKPRKTLPLTLPSLLIWESLACE
jgi:hypothetical protein